MSTISFFTFHPIFCLTYHTRGKTLYINVNTVIFLVCPMYYSTIVTNIYETLVLNKTKNSPLTRTTTKVEKGWYFT